MRVRFVPKALPEMSLHCPPAPHSAPVCPPPPPGASPPGPLLAACFIKPTLPLLPCPVAEVGIEMKFKDMKYPVLIGATHVPELNEIRVRAGGGGRRRVCSWNVRCLLQVGQCSLGSLANGAW